MGDMTRIKLNRDYVESIIPITKTIKEMAQLCGCSVSKLRGFLKENDLFQYYCEQHHRKYNPETDNLACSVCGSKTDVRNYKGIPYCKRHYLQMWRHGKILETTIYDRNEIIIDGDIARIIIKDAKQNIKDICIIDAEDIDKVKNYKWYTSYNYCVTKSINSICGTDISNVIFNDYENKYDHINHNRLDNRKINLRPVTSHQNAMNMGKKITNTSGVTGVRQDHDSSKWAARITYNYKDKWLGSYNTFDEAVKARLKAEIKYFKEYSPNYDPDSKTIQLSYYSPSDKQNHFIEYSLEGDLLQCY